MDLPSHWRAAWRLCCARLFELPPEGTTSVPQLPLAAVILSAWYGDTGPGLFAWFICAAGILVLVRTLRPHRAPFEDDARMPRCGFLHLQWRSACCSCGVSVRCASMPRTRFAPAREAPSRPGAVLHYDMLLGKRRPASLHPGRRRSDGLSNTPARGAEMSKTRWESRPSSPTKRPWREHRATNSIAQPPFTDLELARPSADGGKRYVSVSGMPVFDAAGHFVG